ncbi:tetratricopeptide (TPR) repeat protein [Paraburkholderia bannensis]|uniref:Tetratricopeptide (TPR) repeat protein n=1 Tax=Paraburkholderia bannensis TaxID=765414 RepID=A0A7W9TYN4_9BURK|nr:MULTISPECIES: tetratricopeptide repeat protein [Paraburkholderia]MBB3258103.1 tetratricopeptide (TPR) repeat protein [Paraburkholderia sp. WP4_3_2]MBB6103116.1 tetratricopeptide (TPR) repeat protein [Paraburkholderia bannensis]
MTDANDALIAQAQQHFTAGRFDATEQVLQSILQTNPDHAGALEAMSFVWSARSDYVRAAEFAWRAARPAETPADQLQHAARICQLAQRHADAVALYERLLALVPDHAASLHGAAMSLVQLEQGEAALEYLARLTRRNPKAPEVHYNRGALLGKLGRYDEELDAYRRAIELKPDFVAAWTNLGVALRDLHRFDDALRHFKKAVSINPNDAGARTNRAQTNLLLGEFEHGWREYEWRWRDGTMSHGLPDATQWKGQPLAGKTVFVHAEQGFGDTVQFVRFVDRLHMQGAHVIVQVQDELVELLQGVAGAASVIGEASPAPAFDYHLPMLSLPHALALRKADFAPSGAYLHADAAAARAAWSDVIGAEEGDRADQKRRLRVGVVWSGNTTHLNDRNRSMPLTELLPLFDADARFVSLQKDVRERDRACVDDLVQRGRLIDAGPRLTTFSATAALIAQLDLVIAVDTAVAHLAGALGKPVWIALPFTPDWRWQMHREDSPWYANARLFRQIHRNQWDEVVKALCKAIDVEILAQAT